MKTFFRYFLFLILCLSCYTASAGTDDNVGYIVGNSYGVGPSDQKWRETGPNGDVTVVFRYGTSTNNLVFYKPTQLGPTGVKLHWSQLDTASGGGFLYCNRSNNTSGGQCVSKMQWLTLEKDMVTINYSIHLFPVCIIQY